MNHDPEQTSGAGGDSSQTRAKRSAVSWGIGALIAVLILTAWYAIDVLLLIFAGVLFAIFLRSLSDLLHRHTRLPAGWSLGVVVVVLLAVTVGGVWLLAPRIAGQIDQLADRLPKAAARLQERVQQYEWGRELIAKTPAPEDLMPRRRDLVQRVTGVVSTTFGALAVPILIFFTGLFFAAQPRLYVGGLLRLVPPRRRPRARAVLGEIGHVLKWWLIGKVAAMLFIGVLTAVGLRLLGIDLAITLAILAAILTFIPNFGPILAAVPAVLLGLAESPTTAIWVVLLYMALQAVESYLLTPMIQQRTVNMPPALTISAQLLIGVWVGGIGLALATPLTAAAMVLVRRLYVEDILGDSIRDGGETSSAQETLQRG